MQNQKICLCIFLWILASGCSSPTKRGKEALGKGLYDDALGHFEQALAKDPNDGDAKQGLNQARNGWIDHRLIDVRKARLGGSSAQALDLLNEIVAREQKWGMAPSGNAVFTQDEELSDAARFSRGQVEEDIRASFPLRAAYFLKKYRPLFSGAREGLYDDLHSRVFSKGKSACVKLKHEKTTGLPYFSQFISEFCRYFGERILPATKSNQVGKEVAYFKAVKFTGMIEGASEDLIAGLKSELQKQLESTAWYDWGAKQSFEIPLKGRFSVSHLKDRVNLTHVYTVQEPYTEYVKVQKQRSVPYTERHSVLDATAPGGQRWVEQTSYRTEYYTVDEPRTAYRSVPRNYYYSAWKHRQTLDLKLESSSRSLGDELNLSLGAHSDTDGIEHDENQASIGLKPSRPQLPDPSDWFRSESIKWVREFGSRAIQAWKNRYCVPDEKAGSFAESGNTIRRCLRQKMSDYPVFAENWYQSRFGVSAAVGVELLQVDGETKSGS